MSPVATPMSRVAAAVMTAFMAAASMTASQVCVVDRTEGENARLPAAYPPHAHQPYRHAPSPPHLRLDDKNGGDSSLYSTGLTARFL